MRREHGDSWRRGRRDAEDNVRAVGHRLTSQVAEHGARMHDRDDATGAYWAGYAARVKEMGEHDDRAGHAG